MEIEGWYAFWYYFYMASPTIKKPSDLRENLYQTLEKVCEGEKFIIPTKHGDVILMKKSEHDLLEEEQELLKDFEEPINFDELTDHETVFKEFEKRHGLNSENLVVKKSRQRS
jgi:PHD/YefM family antitoxin component YafN of YafNO toxin-antitoxin module